MNFLLAFLLVLPVFVRAEPVQGRSVAARHPVNDLAEFIRRNPSVAAEDVSKRVVRLVLGNEGGDYLFPGLREQLVLQPVGVFQGFFLAALGFLEGLPEDLLPLLPRAFHEPGFFSLGFPEFGHLRSQFCFHRFTSHFPGFEPPIWEQSYPSKIAYP